MNTFKMLNVTLNIINKTIKLLLTEHSHFTTKKKAIKLCFYLLPV